MTCQWVSNCCRGRVWYQDCSGSCTETTVIPLLMLYLVP